MALETENTVNPQTSTPNKGKKKVFGLLILGGIPLIFVLYLVLGPVLDIVSKDISAQGMFVISEFVNVRATSDINSLKMGTITYGTKVLVYEKTDDWAKVLIDGQKVYLSSKFIVEPEIYYTIEGLFGDQRASNLIKGSKYRFALYRYFESKGFTSDIADDIKARYFKGSTEKDVYQIYSEPKGAMFTCAVFADFDGDFAQDAAFVIKHKDSDDKLLVIFSFDKKDPLNSSKVIYEGELEEPWMAIKLAKKGTSYDLYKNKKLEEDFKLPVNGIVIGSNRSKTLKDPVQVFFYDGSKFDTYKVNTAKK